MLTSWKKIRDEYANMREATLNEANSLDKETSSRETSDLASFTESENAKNKELENIQKALEEKGSLNKKKELMLRKKKARVEKEVQIFNIE